MKKMGLGRGLDALLPDIDNQENAIVDISITKIDNNPNQPRKLFNQEALDSLAQSIQSSGILQPLLVVQEGKRYRIIAGERRFRAAHLAGLKTLPCIVRSFSQQEKLEASLIENLQREDLNAIEEAIAIRGLIDEIGYTQEVAAKQLGKSRSALTNLLRLLNLDDDMQQAIIDGTLSAGHGRVLAGIEDDQKRRSLFEQTLSLGLSVRNLELLSTKKEKSTSPTTKQHTRVLPELTDMLERLQTVVGVKTTLVGNEKKGKLMFQYKSAEELALIYAALEVLENKE